MTVKVAESKARVGVEAEKRRGCSPRWPKAAERGKGWHSPSHQVPGENRWFLESCMVQAEEPSGALDGGQHPRRSGTPALRLTPVLGLPGSDGSVFQPPVGRAQEGLRACWASVGFWLCLG